eukprot:gene1541-1704_t
MDSDSEDNSSLTEGEVDMPDHTQQSQSQEPKRKRRKQSYHTSYKNKVSKLAGKEKARPMAVLLIYKLGNKIHYEGNPSMVAAFKNSKEVATIIDESLVGIDGMPKTKKPKGENFVNEDIVRTLVDKGVHEVLKDDLVSLITSYATGGRRVRNFWGISNADINRPDTWWPQDIPFSSPNIRERDASEDKPVLTSEHISRLGEAATEDILKNGLAEMLSECADEQEVNKRETIVEFNMNLEKLENSDNLSLATSQNEAVERLKKAPTADMSPNAMPREQHLHLADKSMAALASFNCKDWKSFARSVSEVDCQHIEQCQAFISCQDEFYLRNMPGSLDVTDQKHSKRGILPSGMVVGTATSFEGSLYKAVSRLLFGNEATSVILRLLSIVEAVNHTNHYVNEYRERCITVDAVNRMIFALSTSKVFHSRPRTRKASAREILRFAIESEILEMAKEDCPSGLLQVRFLATVLLRGINVYSPCNEELTGFMSPCSCFDSKYDPINILLENSSEIFYPNTFTPLFWKTAPRSPTLPLPQQRLEKLCTAKTYLGCHAKEQDFDTWVTCRGCHLLYHAACSGLGGNEREFLCCVPSEERHGLMGNPGSYLMDKLLPETNCILKWPPPVMKPKASEGTVILSMFDLYTVHSDGITSSIVNFWLSFLQNSVLRNENALVASTENASTIYASNNMSKKRLRNLFPRDQISGYDLLIFPCVISELWHWVAFIFSRSQKWMCVLDSLGQGEELSGSLKLFEIAVNALEELEGTPRTSFRYMAVDDESPQPGNGEIGLALVRKKHAPKQTNNIDCGPMILLFVEALIRENFEMENGIVVLDKDMETANDLRRKIIYQIYTLKREQSDKR